MEHSFNVRVAQDYDVNIATFLHNLKFWTHKNLANKKHIHDGYCWSYNTLDALQDLFPYWSQKNLRTIIKNSLDAGLIVKGNYNQTQYDRTLWYALTPKAYEYYPELQEEKYRKLLILTICPNGQMEMPVWANRNARSGTPIPDSNPDSNPDNLNPLTPLEGEKKKKEKLSLSDLQEDNPHEIPTQLLQDFLTTRKSKRAPVTYTAWNRLQKTLIKIKKKKGINPVDAFEEMVANGWQSLKPEYFDSRNKKESGSNWTYDKVLGA